VIVNAPQRQLVRRWCWWRWWWLRRWRDRWRIRRDGGSIIDRRYISLRLPPLSGFLDLSQFIGTECRLACFAETLINKFDGQFGWLGRQDRIQDCGCTFQIAYFSRQAMKYLLPHILSRQSTPSRIDHAQVINRPAGLDR
jgi:hypothetical protein